MFSLPSPGHLDAGPLFQRLTTVEHTNSMSSEWPDVYPYPGSGLMHEIRLEKLEHVVIIPGGFIPFGTETAFGGAALADQGL